MKTNVYHHSLYQCKWAETTNLISVYCLTYLSDQPQLKQIIRFYTKEYITKPPSMFIVRFQQFYDVTFSLNFGSIVFSLCVPSSHTTAVAFLTSRYSNWLVSTFDYNYH